MTCVCDAVSVSKISARVGMIPLLETRQNDSRTERLRFSQRESYTLLDVLKQRSSAPSLHARHSTVLQSKKLLLSCSFGHAELPPRIPKHGQGLAPLLYAHVDSKSH